MMKDQINVVQYGLGPIGVETAKLVLAKSKSSGLRLVGAIDIDPAKVGKDVSEILGLSEPTGIKVSDNAQQVFDAVKPHVALHTTTSFLQKVYPQLTACIESGVHVVSSTEELLFPYDRHPDLSRQLDDLAKKHHVAVLGTGVNPGFVMDVLPLVLTGVCTSVRAIRVERVVDASKRRLPLQRKIGAGITTEEFEEKKKTGVFGHIGLRESLLFVADGLGWKFDRVQEALQPMVASREIVTPYFRVQPGRVSGIHHTIAGSVGAKEILSLDLKMYVGADDPHDAVYVDGDPPVDAVIRSGVFGDSATVAALVNAIPLVLQSPPGLQTLKDLPAMRAFKP